MSIRRLSCRGLTLLICVLGVFPLLLGSGCPSSGSGGGAGTVTVRSPNLDQSVAVGGQVTIVYDAPDATSVQAFYDQPMLQAENWAHRAALADMVFEDRWGHLAGEGAPGC